MPTLPPPLAGYAHFAAHAALAASAALLSSLLSLPSRLLYGLHTYIHPDTLPGGGDGFRAAIRPPSDPGDQPQSQLRRRPRSGKDGNGGGRASKSVFDESNANLLRLRLVDSHLRNRLYFPGYRGVLTATLVALSSLLLGRFVPAEGLLAAAAVPVLTSLFAVCYVFFSVAKIAFEWSATKRSLTLYLTGDPSDCGALQHLPSLCACRVSSSCLRRERHDTSGWERISSAGTSRCW